MTTKSKHLAAKAGRRGPKRKNPSPLKRLVHVGGEAWSWEIRRFMILVRSPDHAMTVKLGLDVFTGLPMSSIDGSNPVRITPEDVKDFIENDCKPVRYENDFYRFHYRHESPKKAKKKAKKTPLAPSPSPPPVAAPGETWREKSSGATWKILDVEDGVVSMSGPGPCRSVQGIDVLEFVAGWERVSTPEDDRKRRLERRSSDG